MAAARLPLALAALAALLAAGCGGLDAPDLATGQIVGTVTGARPGAYAYVVGAPQLKGQVVDGAFRLDRVPVGPVQVVVYDGEARAELIAVDVKPASRARLARAAADMPLAGRIVAVPRPAGGAASRDARASVDGTDLADVAATAPGGLFPLPPGEFSVRGALRGFKGSPRRVRVREGASVPVELELDVDLTDPVPGCLAAGCASGLLCSGDDGRCYECASDADCGSAGSCSADRVCTNRPLGCGEPCAAGACGAGLACDGASCVAPGGCALWMQSFGSSCAFASDAPSDTCARALAGGRCYVPPGATEESGEVGSCTASCASSAECPTSYACDTVAGVCVR